ncbi:MAG: aminotransferase class I/II-fold pyridoxal phosphate-dependent enzyme [Chloroflexi bacterium]|nr:aminotransferase class I/II-fold pyridoxal phosphate-dependent enzyme [Chloroflexota bacterium]MCI0578168.1 aminotransferase class I/II-fold pyridoxal phosphate-dependent enzyme [Chloroflexota bacterium]MCI0649668.1 aminotransferase class I/II-fold pyridoxal phosphate-dependent enzyme [Chloroflexota bacterium]MCI0731226.1 aminotransferase class I/II-fold pyridoxal phosphate-dependent enzyme [Chloroflexota bacterium]
MINLAEQQQVETIVAGERPDGASTRAVHGRLEGRRPQANHSLVTPLVQTATYTFHDTADLCAFMEAKMWGGDPAMAERGEYGRYGNPTVQAVERRLAALENGGDALLFPTGMAAVTNVLLSMLSAGSHVIFTDDCYRRTRYFCNTFLRRLGIETTQVPMGDYEALEAAIRPNTRLILSESPTNPYLRVVDLERLVAIGRHHRVKTLIDATFATPVNQRPLEFGVDLVIHSATKYLGGHNDIMAGAAVGEAGLIHALRQSQGVLGGVLDPHAAYLLERGLKTLALRVRQQNQTAQAVAEYLAAHPKVERVWYPGLPSHPDYAVATRQMSGFGGVVSFEIGPRPGEEALDTTSRFIDAMTIPYIAPSLGGVESLIEQPALMSYYELSTEERLAVGIKDNLVRFAIGVEDTADILADLDQALAQI